MIKEVYLFFFVFILLLPIVYSAEVNIDVKVDKEIYSPGDNLTFNVLLFQDGEQLNEKINVTLSHTFYKKVININTLSNKDNVFSLDADFFSGYWEIKSSFGNRTVKRIFSIKENQEAEFKIVGDKLIISNKGNSPYTKTIKIVIGDEIITQKQNIDIGESKEIRLIAPDGVYEVGISDGNQEIRKEGVSLTGDVIGAFDENLFDNAPIIGVVGSNLVGPSKSKKNIFPLIFVGMLFFVWGLLLLERRIKKRFS